MMIMDDIVGKRIGIYDVVSISDVKASDGHKLYHVLCSVCGWSGRITKQDIKRAKKCTHISIDCKYKRYDTVWKNKRIKSIFSGMKERCYNKNCKSYMWYGGKGIKICDEWMREPYLFESWSIENGYDDTLTIDRINENEDYCPENCRWVSMGDNAKYKSTTNLIKANGELHTGREWSNILNFGANVINKYVRKYGKENTEKFIEKYLENPGMKPSGRKSYYELYMDK